MGLEIGDPTYVPMICTCSASSKVKDARCEMSSRSMMPNVAGWVMCSEIVQPMFHSFFSKVVWYGCE